MEKLVYVLRSSWQASCMIQEWSQVPSKHERCTPKCLQGMQKFRDRSLVGTWHDIWHMPVKEEVILKCYQCCFLLRGRDWKQMIFFWVLDLKINKYFKQMRKNSRNLNPSQVCKAICWCEIPSMCSHMCSYKADTSVFLNFQDAFVP